MASVAPGGTSLFWDTFSVAAGAGFGPAATPAYGPTPNQPPTCPAQLTFQVIPNHPDAVPQLFAYSTGQQMLREMSWEDLEDSVIDIIDRTFNKEGGDFDPERDIHDWRINRWSYGYAHELTSTFDPSAYGPVEGQAAVRGPPAVPQREHRELGLGDVRLHPQRDQRGLPRRAGPARPLVELIAPTDAGYDRLRAVFDQRVDRRPAVVARCRSRDDVAAALALAAARGPPCAVRGGAADAGATIEGGVGIDVSPMKGIEIDAGARTARVAAGVTWAELDAATQRHGLAVTGARVSWLGVAGVALGAGSGWLERSLGPTGRSVLRAEGLLPDGSTVAATGIAAPPGAAVVTELVLRLHPVGPVLLCGFLTFSRARAGEVARAYRELMAGAPAEVGGALTLFAGRAGACQLAVCFHGDVADGERWIAPLRALGPSLDAVAANPYRAFQAMTDTLHPFGMRAERATRPVGALSDDMLEAMLAAAEQPAAALSRLVLRPRGGRLEGEPWEAECLAMWLPSRASTVGTCPGTSESRPRSQPRALPRV